MKTPSTGAGEVNQLAIRSHSAARISHLRFTASVALSVITLLTGCASTKRGPAYGHERQFREQLASNTLVKTLGYRIEDVRFSQDYQKALVMFADPAQTNTLREVVLEHDGFRRYRGNLYLPVPPENVTLEKLKAGMHAIIVDLPAR
jgi:hypothetical protein